MKSHMPFLLALSVVAAIVSTAGSASSQTVRVINTSDWNIAYLYLSGSDDARWGPDQLGDAVLSAGGGWIDIRATCGYYDLRFVDEDADECVVANMHLCNEAVNISNSDLLQCTGVTQSRGVIDLAAPTPQVRLVNASDWNIEYLFLSSSSDARWGPDQLGDDILSAGGDSITFSAACDNYDLRFVDEDGDECVVSAIHLCNETVTISNSDLLACVSGGL